MSCLLHANQLSLHTVPCLNSDIMFKEASYLNPDILFNFAPIGMVVFDKKGKIVKANPFLEQQFHCISGELIGAPIERLFPLLFEGDNKKNIYSLNDEFNNIQIGIRLEWNAHKKDGTEFPVEINLINYETTGEELVIAFISALSKEKKERQSLMQLSTKSEYKAEEMLPILTSKISHLEGLILQMKIRGKRLNRINSFLNNIWEHVDVIIFITDLSGTIKMFNPKAEKKLGYKSSEIINKTTPTLFLQELNSTTESIDLTSQQAMADFSAWTAKADLDLFNEQEVTYLCKDRSSFSALLTLSSIQDENGVPNGYLAIALDISKSKKAEREWKQSLQKEKELSDLKSNFISIASHEFRTPLSTVLSSAYLISKYSELKDYKNIDKHVVRIVTSVSILTNILNDFLSVGKIEEGKIQVRPSTFNLEQHMLKVINELNGLLKKGQTVLYSHTGDTTVILDPILLKHIIINLFSNAIKFSPENTTIEISTSKTDQFIKIKVKDQGIGISIEDQSQLFERFFRGGNVTNVQGTGLGLNIVSKYIELIGGKIKCDSCLNQGTTFTVIFNTTDNQTT